jgi:hypothetical protein
MGMMEIRRHRSIAAAGALLLAAGCASHSASRGELLSSARPDEGRHCSVASAPQQLPAAAQLIDADAFTAQAERLWAGAGKPDGHVVFSVRHGLDGVQVRRSIVESTLPAGLADTLQKLVYAYRRETPAAPVEWGVRLRVDAGETVALRVGRREECTARPRDPGYRSSAFDVREKGEADDLPLGRQTDPGLVWVHVRVDAQGLVTDARVERRVLAAVAEQRVLSYVRGLTFDPALDDGEPVPGEATITVPLQLARGNSGLTQRPQR